MSLFVTSLNSGSNGNCYYVGNYHEAVLIDAGISCSEIERRLKRLNLQVKKIKAVFISHEHKDHIRGVYAFSKKYQLPVYVSEKTLRHSKIVIPRHLAVTFSGNENIAVGNLFVKAFPKVHNAKDPFSFIVEGNKVKIGIFTDIGKPCENVSSHFAQCNAAFLEANYDEGMLANGSYPRYLKNRISGGFGHLSNSQALQLFTHHKPSFMSHLFLSHLSANNNSPEIVERMFGQRCGNTKIIIASRKKETAVYNIPAGEKKLTKRVEIQEYQRIQLSLF